MTNKMKLLIGLLVLGILLIGGGLVFLLVSPRQNGIKITLTPAPGTYLFNTQNQSSDVLLKSIQIDEGASDKSYPGHSAISSVNAGDSIFILSGSIQNNQENKYIAIYAVGYDKSDKQVARTIDTIFPMGQIVLTLETGVTGEFTLHMKFATNIKSIRIFANNYAVPLP